MKIEEFRPSLAPFLAMPGVADTLDPRTLSALVEHNQRYSGRSSASAVAFPFPLRLSDAGTSASTGASTPPLSPAESYAVLCECARLSPTPRSAEQRCSASLKADPGLLRARFPDPPPPHLTPQPSPTGSPRSTSPERNMNHPMPTTHVMGKLAVRVVEARGLAVTSQREKPYVLLQVSRRHLIVHLRKLTDFNAHSTTGPSEPNFLPTPLRSPHESLIFRLVRATVRSHENMAHHHRNHGGVKEDLDDLG